MSFIQLSGENLLLHSHRNVAGVDVVAIHGMFEDALQTWTEPTSRVLWLRDLLPKALSNVRVLAYQYKATALTTPGEGADSILQEATTFIAQLHADRDFNNAHHHPIIFVCHGLGGLLLKRALSYSSSRRSMGIDHHRTIYTSTYGILFLGTPHLGISKETLLLAQDDRGPGPNQFIMSLLKGSEMLSDLNDQFAPLMKRFSIFNFWEGVETQFGDTTAYIVDQDSAAPTWNDVEKAGLAANHSAMAKFRSQTDSGYRIMLEAISRYVRRAPEFVPARQRNDREMIRRARQQEADELQQSLLRVLDADDTSVERKDHLCLVPRSSSIYFTGREKQAREVKEILGPIRGHDDKPRNKLVVVFGLGGSGKTQFCLKYVEDNKHRYWGVFWIDASDVSHIESGFASIGQQAGRGSTMSAGKFWLSSCTKPWLLVFDNADDPDLDIEEYSPSGGNGHILVTTRNPRAAEHAREGSLRFRGMEADEAVRFLLKMAYPAGQNESVPLSPTRWLLAKAIAVELGFLPLALRHAGATIRRKIYTLERYLDYYLGQRKKTMSYSKVNTADDANIITTWEIPFQRIVDRATNRGSVEHRDAVDLMHIFAFMHFEAIPEIIFQRPWANFEKPYSTRECLPDILQSAWNFEMEPRLRTAIGVLCDHSIVEYETTTTSCSMHPVIHNWARDRLQPEEQKRWLNCAMRLLSESISPNLEASGRAFRALLLPHINSCLQSHSGGRLRLPETEERATQYERFASVFAEQCQWQSSRKWLEKAIHIRIRLNGRRHPDTIRAQRSLGKTLWNLFEIKDTIIIQQQVLNTLWWTRPSLKDWTAWRLVKPIHTSYCIVLDDLNLSLWLAGEREWSKYAGERAVIGLEKRLGPYDPLTLNAMFNLARTYLHLGQHEKGHKLLVNVARRQKYFFGTKHPDTLMTRNEIGMSLCARGRHLLPAQRIVESVLESRKKILGEEHAYTLWSINDLSKIYVERGRRDDAIKILEDIVPIVKRTLGEPHVGMLMTRSNLAKAYFLAERLEEAEDTVQRLLEYVPVKHPDRIHNLFGLAHIKFKRGSADEAREMCEKMLEDIRQRKIFALDHPRTVSIANLLLRIYRFQDRRNDIETLRMKIPSMEGAEKEGLFDPYAIRKGSDVSLSSAGRAARLKLAPKNEFDQGRAVVKKEPKAVTKVKKSEPKPGLAVRHTF